MTCKVLFIAQGLAGTPEFELGLNHSRFCSLCIMLFLLRKHYFALYLWLGAVLSLLLSVSFNPQKSTF